MVVDQNGVLKQKNELCDAVLGIGIPHDWTRIKAEGPPNEEDNYEMTEEGESDNSPDRKHKKVPTWCTEQNFLDLPTSS